jgi:YwqJ-like deaminase
LRITRAPKKSKSDTVPEDPRLTWRTGDSAISLPLPAGSTPGRNGADKAPNASEKAKTAYSADPVALTGAPVLRHRRDGILPAVAAALYVRGETLTCTGSKADAPPQLHPLITDFLNSLPVEQRERTTGRCPEPILLSRFLTAVDTARKGRAARKPFSHSEAKLSLHHAELTTRRIREDGDPEHGTYAPPCRACTPLLAHFGVRTVDPNAETE